MTATQYASLCVICGEEAGDELCEICSLDSGVRDVSAWNRVRMDALKRELDERMAAHHRDAVLTGKILRDLQPLLSPEQVKALKPLRARHRYIVQAAREPITAKQLKQTWPYGVSLKTLYRDIHQLCRSKHLVAMGATHYQAKGTGA